MNYDQNKMKDYLFNSPSYKHINTFLPAIVDGFDVERYLVKWLDNEENIKFLHCMELIAATENYNQQEYEKILKDVRSNNTIKVEDWCKRTKGKTLLSINDQVFAIDYVAVKIALDLGDDKTKQMLNDTFDAIYDSDKLYENYYANHIQYNSLCESYKRLALHILAEADRYWISLWYQGEKRMSVLYLRANYIAQVFGVLN